MAITKDSKTIANLEEWGRHAGPKSARQWKDGRSAKEAARSWLGGVNGAMPAEIMALMAGHDQFGPVLSWSGEPEVRIPFDKLRGEPRNTDLLIDARDAHGRYLIAVEAKADEAFGTTVESTLKAAHARLKKNEQSGGVRRIDGLVSALFGTTLALEPGLAKLQYQLLTATAGAVAAATRAGCERTVLLIQEFRTNETTDDKHDANSVALDSFIRRLSANRIQTVSAGELVGPFTLQQSGLFDAAPTLFIGKVRHEMCSPTA